MSILDDFMGKVSEQNVPDDILSKYLDLLDVFAKEHIDNTEFLAKAAEVRAALIGKMNNKDIVDDGVALSAGEHKTNENKPMNLFEVSNELEGLRKLENNPEAYMEKCESILKNPRDVTMAEQAIYGLGRVVEKNPSSEIANRAVSALKLCTGNKELLELDTKHPRIHLIENAMKATEEKIENCAVKSSAWKVDEYVHKYSQDRLHTIMNKAFEEYQERNAEDTVYVSLSPEQRARLKQERAAQEKRKEMRRRRQAKVSEFTPGYEKPGMVKEDPKAMTLDEDKLPKIKLAGNAGKDGVVFDLNSIAEDLKALKPGESLALGRAPEEVGAKGKSVKVGENNNYVSRHHCDIRRNEQGKLELVDRSMNGTEVLPDRGVKALGKKQEIVSSMIMNELGGRR